MLHNTERCFCCSICCWSGNEAFPPSEAFNQTRGACTHVNPSGEPSVLLSARNTVVYAELARAEARDKGVSWGPQGRGGSQGWEHHSGAAALEDGGDQATHYGQAQIEHHRLLPQETPKLYDSCFAKGLKHPPPWWGARPVPPHRAQPPASCGVRRGRHPLPSWAGCWEQTGTDFVPARDKENAVGLF